jgi:APA family basic amino acid/polyamine antiporter
MHDRALRRVFGLREAVTLGLGGTIGGGIFVLVGSAAGQAGPAVLVAFGLAFLVSLVIALPYAELACRFPQAGGGYAFARTILGPTWGFFMGWGYIGAYTFASAYVTLGFGGYLEALTGIPTVTGATGLVVVSTIIHLAGARLAGWVQSGLVVLALAGLLGFGLLGLPSVDLARLAPFAPNGVAGVLGAALIAYLAFGGFDMVAAAGEEIERPERNLPLAILLTLASVLGAYLLVAFVAVGVMPWWELGISPAPLAAAAERALGPAGRTLIAVAAVVTTAATGHAVLMVMSRIGFAMGRDGLLPAVVGTVSARTGAPWSAVMLSGALLAGVAQGGSVDLGAQVGGFLYVLHYLPPLSALIILRRRGGPRPVFEAPLPWLLIPLGLLGSAALLLASGPVGITVGVGWLLAGGLGWWLSGLLRLRKRR